MVEKLCKNCVHWERNKSVSEDFGKCKCSKFIYTGNSEYEDIKTDSDSLQYWDYESYKASFETGENFGCIHFREGE